MARWTGRVADATRALAAALQPLITYLPVIALALDDAADYRAADGWCAECHRVPPTNDAPTTRTTRSLRPPTRRSGTPSPAEHLLTAQRLTRHQQIPPVVVSCQSLNVSRRLAEKAIRPLISLDG